MKTILRCSAFIFLLCSGLAARGQEIKVKKTEIYVDGQLFLVIPNRGGNYQVCPPGGTHPLFVVIPQSYSHPDRRSRSNPQGTVHYNTIRFAGFEEPAEIGMCSRKSLARLVLDYQLVSGGELDPEKVREFIDMTGRPFSEEKNRIQIIKTH